MKALVLNGSPRANGTVATLCRAVSEAVGSDTEVAWIDVYQASIRACVGCMRCRTGEICVLPPDDGQRLGALIAEADLLIVGTPTHWGNMSAPLKLLFDRNVPVFMEDGPSGIPSPRQKGKPAVIVTACTTPWPFDRILKESRGAIASVREVLHYGGYRILGTVVKPGTHRKPEIQPRLLRKASGLGARLERVARARLAPGSGAETARGMPAMK